MDRFIVKCLRELYQLQSDLKSNMDRFIVDISPLYSQIYFEFKIQYG